MAKITYCYHSELLVEKKQKNKLEKWKAWKLEVRELDAVYGLIASFETHQISAKWQKSIDAVLSWRKKHILPLGSFTSEILWHLHTKKNFFVWKFCDKGGGV